MTVYFQRLSGKIKYIPQINHLTYLLEENDLRLSDITWNKLPNASCFEDQAFRTKIKWLSFKGAELIGYVKSLKAQKL